jgi:transposase
MKHEASPKNYAGQYVYVGIDVHKKNWAICIVTADGRQRPVSQNPSPEALLRLLERDYPGAQYILAYEAGFSGFWIARWFLMHGIECLVVNPADIPSGDKDRRQKNDTRDARKIAFELLRGGLTPLYIPSEQQEDDRQFVRTRAAVVKKQTRVKNQIWNYLSLKGTTLPKDEDYVKQHWSKAFIATLWELYRDDRQSRRLGLVAYLKELDWIRPQLAELTHQMRELAMSEPYRERYELLLSCPGIGSVAAITLLTELIDIRRFENFDHLASYVGLVPSTYSSGERERSRGITPRTRKELRKLLIQCAWTACRVDPDLKARYKAYSQRFGGGKIGSKKAIILIARILLSRARQVLLQGVKYQYQSQLRNAA